MEIRKCDKCDCNIDPKNLYPLEVNVVPGIREGGGFTLKLPVFRQKEEEEYITLSAFDLCWTCLKILAQKIPPPSKAECTE